MPKKVWATIVALITGVVVAASLLTMPASADDELPAGAIPVNRNCNTDWYVNHDEGDRKPSQTDDGLVFKADQLVHHAPAKDITLADLEPGSFEATPPPSLSSFFSVEVRNPDGTGYATLRYDTADSKWNIGGTSVREADASDIIGKTTARGQVIQPDAKVASFGVGYTANPNNGTKTTVTSVEFGGDTYPLACTPKPTPTVTVTKTTSPPPTKPTPPIPGRTLGSPGKVYPVDVTATTVRVKWTTTPRGAVAFAVYANGARFGTIYGHEFRFRGLKKGTTYTFTIRARGKDAGLGTASSVKVKTKR